jgi:hypothetical protein
MAKRCGGRVSVAATRYSLRFQNAFFARTMHRFHNVFPVIAHEP